jgi:hypothetical protein
MGFGACATEADDNQRGVSQRQSGSACGCRIVATGAMSSSVFPRAPSFSLMVTRWDRRHPLTMKR